MAIAVAVATVIFSLCVAAAHGLSVEHSFDGGATWEAAGAVEGSLQVGSMGLRCAGKAWAITTPAHADTVRLCAPARCFQRGEAIFVRAALTPAQEGKLQELVAKDE